MDSPQREFDRIYLIRGLVLISLFSTVTISESDIGIGSSASNFRGPSSTYNAYPSQSRRFRGSYGAPSTVMTQPYYAYTPSATTYSSYSSGAYPAGSGTSSRSERTYFSYNGKLIRSYKIRSYKRAQKHALDLYPDMLQGIASSRIQFYVTRAGYSRGRYVGLKSYISKSAWPTEIDGLAEHETIGIEVRPSITFTESLVSFFSRSPVM